MSDDLGTNESGTLILDSLKTRFASEIVRQGETSGQRWLEVRPGRIHSLLEFLRDEEGFTHLIDIAGLDHLEREGYEHDERFGVIYILYSPEQNEWVRIKALVPESPGELTTAVDLWPGADWAEREIYDMYGLTFVGHPNLKRILTPDNFEAHPLRKDYPLQGRGERDNFPKINPSFQPENESNVAHGIYRDSSRRRRNG